MGREGGKITKRIDRKRKKVRGGEKMRATILISQKERQMPTQVFRITSAGSNFLPRTSSYYAVGRREDSGEYVLHLRNRAAPPVLQADGGKAEVPQMLERGAG